MSMLTDVREFLTDLVMGDFADNPSSLSQTVNAAIGLIPIIDQILDVRDVTAVIVRCSRKDWHLDDNDKASLAFAAIGVIPSFGSFFKGAVKPLWNNRHLAGRGVQNAVAMLEKALNMSKGGATKWIQAINWVDRTEDAVATAQGAIGLYILLLERISTNPWWAPDPLVGFSKETLPAMKRSMKVVTSTIRSGSQLIQDFLNDMLGEHAVLVLAAVQVAHTHPGTRSPAVQAKAHRMADEKRGGNPRNTLKEKHQKTGTENRADVAKGNTPTKTVMQKTRENISNLIKRPMGLVAEHMIDYHVLNAVDKTYPHGQLSPQTRGPLIKRNTPQRPVELELEDYLRMFTHGIDSLWERSDGKYLVVEAKGREGAPSLKLGKAAKDSTKATAKIPPLPPSHGLDGKQAQLWRMLHDNSDKTGGGREMQMSRAWIRNSAAKDIHKQLKASDYDRRVYLVVSISTAQAEKVAEGYNDHFNAVIKAGADSAQVGFKINHAEHASTHGISVEYSERDIAAVEAVRKKSGKNTRPSAASKNASPAKSSQQIP